MASKSLQKIVLALGLLAFILIFLGVNFVPRIFASPSSSASSANPSFTVRSNYTNENYQRSIISQSSYAIRANYSNENYQRSIIPQLSYAIRPNYTNENYQRSIIPRLSYAIRPNYTNENYQRSIIH